jgi:hypothetical protein
MRSAAAITMMAIVMVVRSKSDRKVKNGLVIILIGKSPLIQI